MRCQVHRDAEAREPCAHCGGVFCHHCLVPVRGHRFCTGCKGAAVAGVLPRGMPRAACPEAARALKMAVCGLFCFGIVLGPLSVRSALRARRTIAGDPRLTGSGIAAAAITLGVAACALWFLGLVTRLGAGA